MENEKACPPSAELTDEDMSQVTGGGAADLTLPDGFTIDDLKSGLNKLPQNSQRNDPNALQNRLDHTLSNLQTPPTQPPVSQELLDEMERLISQNPLRKH